MINWQIFHSISSKYQFPHNFVQFCQKSLIAYYSLKELQLFCQNSFTCSYDFTVARDSWLIISLHPHCLFHKKMLCLVTFLAWLAIVICLHSSASIEPREPKWHTEPVTGRRQVWTTALRTAVASGALGSQHQVLEGSSQLLMWWLFSGVLVRRNQTRKLKDLPPYYQRS